MSDGHGEEQMNFQIDYDLSLSASMIDVEREGSKEETDSFAASEGEDSFKENKKQKQKKGDTSSIPLDTEYPIDETNHIKNQFIEINEDIVLDEEGVSSSEEHTEVPGAEAKAKHRKKIFKDKQVSEKKDSYTFVDDEASGLEFLEEPGKDYNNMDDFRKEEQQYQKEFNENILVEQKENKIPEPGLIEKQKGVFRQKSIEQLVKKSKEMIARNRPDEEDDTVNHQYISKVASMLVVISGSLLPITVSVILPLLLFIMMCGGIISFANSFQTNDKLYKEYIESLITDFNKEIENEEITLVSPEVISRRNREMIGDAAIEYTDVLLVYYTKYDEKIDVSVNEIPEEVKKHIKEVFENMCFYSVKDIVDFLSLEEQESYTAKCQQQDRDVDIDFMRQHTIKQITITLYNADDMTEPEQSYLTKQQKEELKALLEMDIKEIYSFGRDGISLSDIDMEDINPYLEDGEAGSDAVKACTKYLGYTYSQARRFQNGYRDCSSLVWSAYKDIGLSMPVTTAAEEAKWCKDNGLVVSFSYEADKVKPGDLLFLNNIKSLNASSYLGINHVVMYAGNGYIIHASSSKGKVVYCPVYSTNDIVCVGRPAALPSFQNKYNKSAYRIELFPANNFLFFSLPFTRQEDERM